MFYHVAVLVWVTLVVDKHFRLNRLNRRILKEDMKVAEVVKTDEEARQQRRRFEQLQALKAQ